MIVHHLFGRVASWRRPAVVFFMLLTALVVATSKTEAQNIRYDVQIEKRYLLAEKIPAAFSITNIGPGVAKVKDAAMLRISMELKGPINDEGEKRKKYTYDGRGGVPVIHEPTVAPGGGIAWYDPTFVKKPDVILRTGQSTSMKFDDILDALFIEKGVAPGVYTLTVWFDEREKVVKKFRVEVEGEKTYARLLQMLSTGDETTMNWASYYMFKIDEKRALSVIRPMLQSENRTERNWASAVLSSRGYLK